MADNQENQDQLNAPPAGPPLNLPIIPPSWVDQNQDVQQNNSWGEQGPGAQQDNLGGE